MVKLEEVEPADFSRNMFIGRRKAGAKKGGTHQNGDFFLGGTIDTKCPPPRHLAGGSK